MHCAYLCTISVGELTTGTSTSCLDTVNASVVNRRGFVVVIGSLQCTPKRRTVISHLGLQKFFE